MSFKNYREFVNESKTKGQYSYKEMRSFLEKIIKHFAPFKERFNGPHIDVPYDRNASSQVYELEKDLLKYFDTFYKKYKGDDPVFRVTHFEFEDMDLKKKVKMFDYSSTDIKSLFQVAASNPGNLKVVKVSFDSSNQDEFGKRMSAGEYGSLD